MTISFQVPFVAAFQRPRPGKHGGYYSPHSKQMHDIGMLAVAARGYRHMFAGPCHLRVSVYAHKRFDLDNAIKAVADSLNGILWYDDYQVKIIVAERIESPEERMEVAVEEI